MSKPKNTFVASSTSETTELGWKLKRITDTHEMRQRSLMEEYREKSRKLTEEMQAEQTAVFEELRTGMNIPDAEWGDGKDWALNIENLADGTVALVHDSDPSRSHDDCDCPACQLRRAMGALVGRDDDEDDKPVRLH